MDERITITIIIGIIAAIFASATLVVASQKIERNQLVYFLGLVTVAALVSLIGAGIVIQHWWVWCLGLVVLLVWLLYLGMYESAHHKSKARRRH